MTLSTPYTQWEGDQEHGLHPVLTPAWVQLDALYLPADGTPRHVVPDGLDVTGRARALVSGWYRDVNGAWLAVANFHVGYADGRRERVWLVDQLVPAHATRRRDDRSPA